MLKLLNRFRRKDSGQAMVEYVFILALVSIVAVASLTGLGGKVTDKIGGDI